MAQPRILTVFGAAGATGAEVVRQAAEAGWRVRAVELAWPDEADLPPGVERRTADVLNDPLQEHVEGAEAVISTLGVGFSPRSFLDPPPLYTEGTLRIARAMQATGGRRLAVISATFVATMSRGPLHFRLAATVALHNIIREMAQMERILRAMDNIDWTAVRPGWLLDAPLTGDYVVTPDMIPKDLIRTRHADLAHFLLHCVETGAWIGKTPAIARREDPAVNSPAAVLREVMGG